MKRVALIAILASGMTLRYDGPVLSMTVNGKDLDLPDDAAGSPPAGTQVPSPTLQAAYFSAADLLKNVESAKPVYGVLIDVNPSDADAESKRAPGSGTMLPYIHYGSAKKPPDGDGETVTVLNPDHPYFGNLGLTPKHVEAIVAAAPSVKSAVVANDPTKEWKEGADTLDPASMAFLLAWMGYYGTGTPKEQAARYRTWYYKTYGRQAPGGPHNPEGDTLSDAEYTAIRNS